MLSFGVENIKPTFSLTSKSLNILRGTFLVVCLLLNTLFLLFFAVYLVISSTALIFLHFKVQKYHSYFPFGFLNTVYLFYFLFSGFQTVNRDTLSCFFVARSQRRDCQLSVITLTSKNISGTLFLVCLSLNMIFLPLRGILT